MDYVHIGIAISVGMAFGFLVISAIYAIFYIQIHEMGAKLKERIIKPEPEEEPTVCDLLGDPKIFPQHYEIIQAKKRHFEREEKNVHTLIEFIFPAPQITNNKFYNDVTRLSKAFNKQYNSLHLYFRAYPKEDEVSKEVIAEGIDNLTDFNDKLEDLIKELSQLVVCNRPTDKLMEDMDEEIQSVKKYDSVVQ